MQVLTRPQTSEERQNPLSGILHLSKNPGRSQSGLELPNFSSEALGDHWDWRSHRVLSATMIICSARGRPVRARHPSNSQVGGLVDRLDYFSHAYLVVFVILAFHMATKGNSGDS